MDSLPIERVGRFAPLKKRKNPPELSVSPRAIRATLSLDLAHNRIVQVLRGYAEVEFRTSGVRTG